MAVIKEQIFCEDCGDGSTRTVIQLVPEVTEWSDYIIHKKTCSKYQSPPSDGMAAERSARRIRKTQYLGRGGGRE